LKEIILEQIQELKKILAPPILFDIFTLKQVPRVLKGSLLKEIVELNRKKHHKAGQKQETV
jgi:hypothetical protein